MRNFDFEFTKRSQQFVRLHNETLAANAGDWSALSLNRWIHSALSNSKNAVRISSARTMKRFP
jgi:hypothetical protein